MLVLFELFHVQKLPKCLLPEALESEAQQPREPQRVPVPSLPILACVAHAQAYPVLVVDVFSKTLTQVHGQVLYHFCDVEARDRLLELVVCGDRYEFRTGTAQLGTEEIDSNPIVLSTLATFIFVLPSKVLRVNSRTRIEVLHNKGLLTS